ncbi:MAG: hypothetical protein WBX19_12400, partial [Terracidiphilus sp.]
IARVTQGGAARENGLYISMHPPCETVYQRVPVRGIRGRRGFGKGGLRPIFAGLYTWTGSTYLVEAIE